MTWCFVASCIGGIIGSFAAMVYNWAADWYLTPSERRAADDFERVAPILRRADGE
jgi:hypothetical protein